jgi:micrococcal nuclease
METTLYHYRALITSVYDGDTCDADIDLGLSTWVKGEKLRLYRINSPELRGPEREAGLLSRDYLRSLIEGKEVMLQTIRDRHEKFGRYLAELWLQNADGTWVNVNDLLVTKGFAIYKDYDA